MIRDCKSLADYISKNIQYNVDVAVLGLSGGADSSLTAILCKHALGKENVYGVSMPYNEIDLKTFNKDSEKLAVKIGINHLIRPIAKIAGAINEVICLNSLDDLSDLNKGNSLSRSRMCVLYGLSNTLSNIHKDRRIRVIGTGNLSEDFIGYDTKGGDALADIFPIGDLYKSEVYQFLDYFRDQGEIDEEHINRIPSAGLFEGQTDENDLGYSYDQMEPAIGYFLKELEKNNYDFDKINEGKMDEIARFVWKRHLDNKHKHEAQRIIRVRSFCN